MQSLESSTCLSESTLVKMPHCWKSHVMAQMAYTFEKFECPLCIDEKVVKHAQYVFDKK